MVGFSYIIPSVISNCPQFAAQTEYNGFYTSTPIPNPDLTALGAKFGTIEEFVETELKKRYQ
jgi:hypothetical protein